MLQRLSRFWGLVRGVRVSARSTRWMSGGTDVEPLSSEHWREAATVILAAKDPQNGTQQPAAAPSASAAPTFDYKVLLLERNKKSNFMPGANVFPGGTACEADFSIEWANVFRFITKRDLGDIIRELEVGRARPPMLATNRHAGVPPDLGFRIAAIRETFEESGVLLVKGARMRDINDTQLEEFRKKIKLDPRKFAGFCKQLQVVPDVWALREWNNWLTPAVLPGEEATGVPPDGGKRRSRFDNVFYLCCLDWIPLVQCDESETVDAKWVSPNYLFEPESEGCLRGPQQFEIARLHNFQKLAFLHTFSQQRATLGMERYMSVFIECQDGVMAVLPGDDLFPDKPDFEGLKPVRRMPQTIEEIRGATKRHHRQELLKDSEKAVYVCNMELKYGQPVPTKKLQQITGMF